MSLSTSRRPALAAGLTALAVITATIAGLDVGPPTLRPTAGVGESVAVSMPDMFAAIQRDLHLSRDEVVTRLGREDAARRVTTGLRAKLGSRDAGSWLLADGEVLAGRPD
jgi:streptogrisin C